jgi:kynurenine 3-monooxygenase
LLSVASDEQPTANEQVAFLWEHNMEYLDRDSGILPSKVRQKSQKIIVMGAGLGGTTMAILLARRGHQVTVYEGRPDPRRRAGAPANTGFGGRAAHRPSINITLCPRGLRTLDLIGAGDLVRSMAVPAYGRVVHAADGLLSHQLYGSSNEALYSIMRDKLMMQLLRVAEPYSNIELNFNEKCTGVDLATATVEVSNTESGVVSHVTADRIIACDGAFSAVRWQMQRQNRFNLSQQYLDYGYREMTAPALSPRGWTAERTALHFWPRGRFMLMAAPNVDGSFTVTLYMPIEGPLSLESIRTEEDLVRLFKEFFPDALSELPNLAKEYFARPYNTLLTIRCSPWIYKDKVALLGDSAHAIVPFYGQGANACFDDCAVLDDCIDRHGDDWGAALEEYQAIRKPNMDLMADLSIQNLAELQDHVGDPVFQLRKEVERRVHQRYPDQFASLYWKVTFSSMSYVEAVKKDREHRAIIDRIMSVKGIEAMSGDELNALIDRTMLVPDRSALAA